MFLDLIKAAFANAGLDSCCGAHDLDDREDAFTGLVFDKAQRNSGNEDICQSLSDDFLCLRREVADYSVDSGNCALSMERRENEMACFSSFDTGVYCFFVAHFTDHDDIR